jgi:hypothetical protein
MLNLDVRGFQIAMDDVLLVRRFERLDNLPCDWQRFVERKRSLGNALGERGTFDELEY